MIETEENNDLNLLEDSNPINLREEIDKYLLYWRWFAAGICIAFCFAFVYIKYTPAQYSASAFIMIKDNLKSGISDELKAVADLGIVGTGSTNNPENEIFIIKSRKIIGEMVDSLELNISYFVEGNIRTEEIYGANNIKVEFTNKDALYHSIDTSFVVSFIENNKLLLKNNEEEVLKEVHFNETIESEKLGQFKIIKNRLNTKTSNDVKEVIVVIKPRKSATSAYVSRIKVSSVSESSSILHLEVTDANKLKAENILDELIKQYNLDAVNDKNIVSKNTKKFIEERLKSVGLELAIIQDSLKSFKTGFGISGYFKESELAIQSISVNDAKVIQLKTQLSLINWGQEELNKQSTENQILPDNLGFSDEVTSRAISELNQLILEKIKLIQVAGDKNPNLVFIQNKIDQLKQNLQSNFKNLKKSIEIQLVKANLEAERAQKKVSRFPLIERGIIDIQRQKIIYSELYSYLLKKKEEIAISLAVTVSNARIIDVAFGSDISVYLKKKIIYLMALAVGLLLPFILIYIKFTLDSKIHNRKDIEDNLSIPYLGDIPHSESTDKVIVKKETRTSSAEAFRILRTNLSFMLPKTNGEVKGKTIFITSTISGEGKSFVSINLAASLALTNKKVLLVGLDLRAPKITDYLGIADRKGVTNYLLDDKLSIDDLKFTLPDVENVDFIVSGVIPPNPSELLSNPKIKEFFETVKNDYDYVIADTAPISLVADTLLIADLADLFLYVTRANHLDKRMLIVPKTLYKEKKLTNMAIVLNDTDTSKGYGYGYGYVEKEKIPFYKKMFGL